MLLQDQKKIVPGVGGFVGPAAVDEDGPLARGGDFKLADQALALHVARRALVIVVEADFAAGDDFRLGEKCVQLGESFLIGCDGDVRVDARAGIEARQFRPIVSSPVELAAEIERLMHLRRPLADADGEHRTHAGFPCAAQHRFAIVCVAGTVKVSVGIDQQTGLLCGVGSMRGIWFQFNGTKRERARL